MAAEVRASVLASMAALADIPPFTHAYGIAFPLAVAIQVLAVLWPEASTGPLPPSGEARWRPE